jgi:hypothetical protein
MILSHLRHAFQKRKYTKWQLFRFFSPVVVAGFVFFTHWLAERVHGVSRISAQTELISFVVTNAQTSSMALRGFRVARGDSPLERTCISGALAPVLDATVTYGRPGWGPLTIRIAAPGHADSPIAALFTPWKSDRRIALSSPVELVFDPSCKLPRGDDEALDLSRFPVPYGLPVFGRATLGSESHSARATRVPYFSHGALYPVDVIDLPVGSRIDARRDAGALHDARQKGHEEEAEEGANWAGVVFLDPFKPGLTAEVETDTTSLRIVRPNTSEPDVIEVTGVKEAFEDPGLLILYKTVALLVFFAGVCGWAADHIFGKKPSKESELAKELKECLERFEGK